MNPTLHAHALRYLLADYAFKNKDKWLTEGICPDCGKKTVYTPYDAPWVLRCNRLNHCGYEEHLKDRYPDLFEEWSSRYPKTPENPHAAADAYLRDARGFDLDKIKGWYTQDSYFSQELNIGSSTVRFPLAKGAAWERIFDKAHRFGKRKANFRGDYGGTWWSPPPQVESNQDKVWIVEGIFDAISLFLHGHAAVSIMSCNNYPALALDGLKAQCAGKGKPELVWALDSDKAGREYTLKWIARARAEGWPCAAAQVKKGRGKKLDWNDLHLLNRINDDELADCLYRGALLIAPSAMDKALLIYGKHQWRSFHFDFGNRQYWFNVSLEKLAKESERILKEGTGLAKEEVEAQALASAAHIEEIITCLPIPLYSQRHDLTDERWFYFRIDMPNERAAVKNTFTSSQLSTPTEFRKRLLHIADGIATVNQTQLDRLLKSWTWDLKTVHTIDFQGYSKDHKAYIFGELAMKNGKLHQLNEEDFFELPKLAIKTLNKSLQLHINPQKSDFKTDWVETLFTCYGPKGTAALAWWLGSLFAEQIRLSQKSFPFLEVVGEAGSGKSTLLEFLWKLLGRVDYEGFPPHKSTTSGRMRNYSQVSNMPVVMIESDGDKSDSAAGRPAKYFDFSELKDLYNGRMIRVTGVKNGGNETNESQFRAAICISQNTPVESPDAIVQRINHLNFTCKDHTENTKTAAAKLETYPIENLSGFLIRALEKEKDILSLFAERMPKYEKQIRETGVRNFRIAKNHAQHMALVACLNLILPLSDEIKDASLAYLPIMAQQRQHAINLDHPIVQEFWDIYEWIEGQAVHTLLNHSRNEGMIAINLVHFCEVAASRRNNSPHIADLKRYLNTSRHRKFIEVKAVNSAVNEEYNRTLNDGEKLRPKIVRCWIFKEKDHV